PPRGAGRHGLLPPQRSLRAKELRGARRSELAEPARFARPHHRCLFVDRGRLRRELGRDRQAPLDVDARALLGRRPERPARLRSIESLALAYQSYAKALTEAM